MTAIAGLPALHSVNEVAKHLGRDVYELRAHIRREGLPVVEVSRRNWRLTDEQYAALLASLTKNHDAPDADMDRDRERAQRHAARSTAPKPRRTAA